MPKVSAVAPSLEHSWDFSTWPKGVYPGDGVRAKYIFRVHQRELLAEGACARVGRTIVFFGAGYSRFLQRLTANVPGYRNGAAVSKDAVAP